MGKQLQQRPKSPQEWTTTPNTPHQPSTSAPGEMDHDAAHTTATAGPRIAVAPGPGASAETPPRTTAHAPHHPSTAAPTEIVNDAPRAPATTGPQITAAPHTPGALATPPPPPRAQHPTRHTIRRPPPQRIWPATSPTSQPPPETVSLGSGALAAAPPRRNSGLCHVCTGGKQHKAQKENGLVSGL